MPDLTTDEIRRLRSGLRLFCILQAANEAGLSPVPLGALHTIAYFTDALAPIWAIPVVEGQVLKRQPTPIAPDVQTEIDQMVGRAIFQASNVRHVRVDTSWRLDADYSLNPQFAERILNALSRDSEYVRELAFVREVVLALAGLGVPGIAIAAEADASYGDPSIEFGDMVDLDQDVTRTTQVAQRFEELLNQDTPLSEAELTHLYVRHLYRRIGRMGG